jgi:prepilin-type N-terminal cleavage/methylation domain-containing protein
LSRGFTLLETLITLVFFGVIVSLSLQVSALPRAFGLFEKRTSSNAMEEALLHRWWRDSVSATIDMEDSAGFSGTKREFRGATGASLDGVPGRPTTYGWRLGETESGALQLEYLCHDGVVWPIQPMRAAYFSYLDHDGGEHEIWPPSSESRRTLPVAIRLHFATPAGHAGLVAFIPTVVSTQRGGWRGGKALPAGPSWFH